MALFTDGPLISAEDMQKCENSILNLASIESIDLAGKIALAQGEIANQLLLFLLRRLPPRNVIDVPWARQTRDINDVVVTEPLRQWHVHKALAMVYRDAYNNQLNDRYQSKWTEYEQLAKASSQNYFRIGVGVVADPIAKASIPLLSTTAGVGSGGTFYAAVAWMNGAGQEGNASNIAEITTSDGQQVVITAVNPPANATSWNAYVGISPETMSLQNSAPIAINSSWAMILGVQRGIPPGKGQPATWFLVDNHVIQRG
jgi:hypothetical protein